MNDVYITMKYELKWKIQRLRIIWMASNNHNKSVMCVPLTVLGGAFGAHNMTLCALTQSSSNRNHHCRYHHIYITNVFKCTQEICFADFFFMYMACHWDCSILAAEVLPAPLLVKHVLVPHTNAVQLPTVCRGIRHRCCGFVPSPLPQQIKKSFTSHI